MRIAFAVAAAALTLPTKGAIVEPRKNSPAGGNTRFTLEEVRNENFKGHDAVNSFVKAHLKYGDSLPPQMSQALENNPDLRLRFATLYNATQRGTVKSTAPAKYDSEFAVTVQIGTPGQKIPLNLDTGSADLWVFSSETYSSVVNGQALYHPENSSTSRVLPGHSWQVKYGDGAGASGIVYKDKVQVGNSHFDQQAVQAAITVSPEIANDTFTSGIIGMANSGVNTIRPNKQRTYIDNVKSLLEEPVFTANLRKAAPGNYNFGYINKTEHTGEIQYAAVNPVSPYWQITVGGYQVGENPFERRPWNAIVDTGTSLLLLPADIVYNYYKRIPDAGLDLKLGVITFPCAAKPPDFTFGLGPYRGHIPGEYINYAKIDAKYCYGGIQTSKGMPFAVLGDVALKAQFVVFNYAKGLVGFANKKL
ncbi:putative aspartyl protease [Ophiocordyceps polyrhachis-furcata BCC 54312]|uniref:Aspartyl protease n=1 Tax=Ophiocordyceps polyrhachis-furcata BCC 54312 TaxID=1330021 RepID=A0A367LLR2_9HYPO|nr:putative aspartyl protease [Ophiocordyceps polyrhachis-furcata BCC 54312]